MNSDTTPNIASMTPDVSFSASVDEILITLYSRVTEGPQALLRTLQSLYQAIDSNIRQSTQPKPDDAAHSVFQIHDEAQQRKDILQSNHLITQLPSDESEPQIKNLSSDIAESFGLVNTNELCIDPELASTQSFFITEERAHLPFYNDGNLQFALQLTFADSERCLKQVDTPKSLELAPHLQQALAMCYELKQQKQDLCAIHHVIKHYPMPYCVLDNHSNTIFVSEAMQTQYDALPATAEPNAKIYDHLRSQARDHFDFIKLCDKPSEREQLKKHLKTLSKASVPSSVHMTLCYLSKNTSIILANFGEVPNLFRHYTRDSLVWVYVLNGSYESLIKHHPDFLSLGLSQAEQALCTLLFEGNSLQDISSIRSVSKQTVRKQLQSVLRKTECESQEALIKFMFEHYIQHELIE